MPEFKNQWSVASCRKWRRRLLLKVEGFQTFKGSWPWPLIASYCKPSCNTSWPLPTSKFHWNRRIFCRQTDRHTYIWTDGQKFEICFIRSIQKGRPNEILSLLYQLRRRSGRVIVKRCTSEFGSETLRQTTAQLISNRNQQLTLDCSLLPWT